MNVRAPTFDIILPIGISFYTFHSITYIVDSYRGVITPTVPNKKVSQQHLEEKQEMGVNFSDIRIVPSCTFPSTFGRTILTHLELLVLAATSSFMKV